VSRQVLRVAWYRLRATFGRRWGGYLTLVLLIGLVGGIAMASIAAARRTQSSFPAFLASTKPSDLVISVSDQAGTSDAVAAGFSTQIAHLPAVTQVRRFVHLNAAQLGPNGPLLDTLGRVERYGSVDGLYFDQDRPGIVRGRMADPKKPDELVLTTVAAQMMKLHVGDIGPWAFITNAQANAPGAGTPGHIALQMRMKVVGLIAFKDAIVQDDVDRFPTAAVFTPALTRLMPPDSAVGGPSFTYYGLQLVHGSRDVAAVEKELLSLVPLNTNLTFHVTSLIETKVERAVRPESIALGVFGTIAGLAALLIALQVLARLLQADDEDRQVLRALGAGPAAAVDGLIGVLGAIVSGALLAAVIAVALSPLSPIGPARRVYPTPGISVDWTVVGVGMLVLVGGLGAAAAFLSYWRAPQRVAQRSSSGAPGSNVVRLATASGLPVPAMVGVRFALEPGRGRTAVPVRSALTGAALSVVMVVATLTFGSSLRTLVSHPALYGWNWTYMLSGNPWVPPQARALLDHDPHVAAWTGLVTVNIQIDGQTVPVLLGQPRMAPAPPILSGHGLETDKQIVLGAATLAELHKRVGDTVVASLGNPQDPSLAVPPVRLAIAGTATMPAIGQPIANQDHTTMGTGGLLPLAFFPPELQQALHGPDPTLSGPGLVLVEVRHGVSRAAGLADMQRITDATNQAIAAVPNNLGAGSEITLQSVQHPAEIVNYKNLGTTPALLDVGLAAGAILALGLTLVASVRRRRRDLALLKTFGFTTRQLAATVAWQASVAGLFGIAVGIPLGVGLGRWLWILFAHDIYAVPQPTVPVIPIALVGLGALVLANIVSALPGHVAARTPSALLLRAE
jgi:hypothetical protein